MIDFIFNADALQKLEQAMIAAPDVFEQEFSEAANDVGAIWHQDLSAYAREPDYPIHWDSERQRKAFFRTDGFGMGIPHQRTGRLPDSWQQEITTTPTLIKLKVFSSYERAHFIQDANLQSNIHQGRWTNTVQNELSTTYKEVTDRFVKAAEDALKRIADQIK